MKSPHNPPSGALEPGARSGYLEPTFKPDVKSKEGISSSAWRPLLQRAAMQGELYRWRGPDEKAQFGRNALTFRDVRDGKAFNHINERKNLSSDRRRFRLRGEADGTGRRIRGFRGFRMRVRGFYTGHQERKQHADHGDRAHHLAGLELSLMDHLHLAVRRL